MKSKIALLFLFSCLLLAPIVSAEIDIQTYETTSGFSVAYGADELSLCQCEPYVENLVITNTGTFASRYTVAFSSPDLVSLSSSQVDVQPGQLGLLHVFYQAPCDRSLDRNVLFTVSDIFGNQESFEKHVSVGRCQNLEASLLISAEGPVKPCEPLTYEVEITNTGVFAEEYEVYFGGSSFTDAFEDPALSITIPAGQVGVVMSGFSLACGVYGNFTVPVEVYALRNGLRASLVHELVVEPAYGFSLEAAPEAVCAYDEGRVPITVTNDAAFENSYSLSVKGPAFATLSEREVTVGPGDETVVYLDVAPAASGVSPVTLTATSVLGAAVQSLSLNLTVLDCYGVSVNVDRDQNVVDCSGVHEYPLIVKNTGSKDGQVRIDVFGSEYASVDQVVVELAAGEESERSLILDVPPGVAFDGSLTVQATVLSVEEVTAQDVIAVKLLDERACFEPVLSQKVLKARYADAEVPFAVRNAGLGAADYDLAFDGPAFFALNASSVALVPGEESSLSLLTYQDDAAPLARYQAVLRLFVRSEDGERVLAYELPVVISLHAKSIFVRSYEYFSAHPCHFVSLILILLIIVSLLVLIALPGRLRRPGRLLAALLAVWVVLVVLVVAFNGLPKALYEPVAASSDDPLLLRFAEDSSYALNLSSYFEDPDGDALDFMVSEMDNVSVVVEGGVVVFTPAPDWFGEKRFRVTAFDGQGGSAESPRMSLEVVDRPEYDAWTLYEYYCAYVNLVLLLFLVVLLSLLFGGRAKEKKWKAPKASFVEVSEVAPKAAEVPATVTSKPVAKKPVRRGRKKKA